LSFKNRPHIYFFHTNKQTNKQTNKKKKKKNSKFILNRFFIQNPPFLFFLNENMENNRFDLEISSLATQLQLTRPDQTSYNDEDEDNEDNEDNEDENNEDDLYLV